MLDTYTQHHRLPRKGLRIAHININSIRNKIDEIAEILFSDNLHILAVSETHLDSTFEDAELSIQGYNFFRRDRNKFGGGVACYIQEHIPVKIRVDLMHFRIEVLWLQIHLPHLKSILVGCCYRPPSANSIYLDTICKMLDYSSTLGHETYFMGDINIDWFSQNCPLKSKLLTVTDTCGLLQVIDKPTRTCLKNGTMTSTCIDHIFTNTPQLCSKVLSVPIGCSDHNLIVIVRNTKIAKPGPKVIIKRSYKMFNQENFVNDVKNVCWSKVLSSTNPDEALSKFDEVLMPLVDKHAPLKKFTVRNARTPWLDNEIKELMKQRNLAKKTATITGCETDWQVYRKLRNSVTKLNRNKKKVYYENRINDIKYNSKKLWNTVNDLLGRKNKLTPSFLEVEGGFITKPSEIANHFNEYFIGKIDKLRNDMPDTDNNISHLLIKNEIMKDNNCKFKFERVSISKVENMIRICKNKPPGVDGLDGKLLKMVADLVAPAICHIMNLSFTKCLCPQDWKRAKIIPLPKNKKVPFSGANSRPISLLPVLSKMMESIVYDQIKKYLSTNNLVTDFQHAYKEGHSTVTAMTQMTDDWLREIEEKKIVGAVLIDFSAAFDIINHNLLLKKLECYGFDQSAVSWFESYLANRTQTVFFNGSYSDVRAVNCGVPQGSCLGPLLYTIFTNDLPLAVKRANIAMYADDSTIYTSALTTNELDTVLNAELRLVAEWVERNELVLNISKTNSMVFGSNHTISKNPMLNLRINDVSINQVHETKLLGITIDNKLSWTKHINKITAKMGSGISAIRRCSSFLTPKATKQVTQALILSNLDYCPVVWSNATVDMIRKLQMIQNRAARIVLRCKYRTKVVTMHKSLNWLFVKERLICSLLVFIRNISVTKTPFILYQNLSFSKDKHNYITRHATVGNFTLPRVRTNAIKRTVMYRAMYEWNLLPGHISQENSKTRFKYLLKQHLRS